MSKLTNQTNGQEYQKISSYEAKPNEIKKVLLLYSGGLDTSMMLKYIPETYPGVEMYTLTLDIGQQNDDLNKVKAKAIKFGAVEAIVYDAKEDFANQVISKAILANACYQGEYHLSTPLGRVITSQIAVKIAAELGCDTIAHGCTGKGNDQVRFDSYITTLNPDLKIIAPVREWNMDREAQIKYANKHKIPVPAKKDFPYSVDDNMWGMTWEGGEMEIAGEIPKVENFLTTYTLYKNAPDQEELVELTFEQGLPIAVNGKKDSLCNIIQKLNKIGGKHGVGVVHMMEDRMVGLKDVGVYELPGANIIIKAHQRLEKYTSTMVLNELKSTLDIKWSYLCYSAKWFDPTMDAINAFNLESNRVVNGTVIVRLFKGTATALACKSDYGLGHASFNVGKEGVQFNANASAGFIEIHSLQMKDAYNKKTKLSN
jgi:argininosuccinate synthase